MSRYEEFSFALLMRVQMLPRSALSQGYEGLVAKSQAGGKSARQVLVIMTWSCIAVYAEMLLKGCNPSPSDREFCDDGCAAAGGGGGDREIAGQFCGSAGGGGVGGVGV